MELPPESYENHENFSLSDNDLAHESIPHKFVPIQLTSRDVPGADLPHPVICKNKVPELKRWLQLRGIPTTGNKAALVER